MNNHKVTPSGFIKKLAWHQNEDFKLEKLCGVYPFPLLVKKLNRYQKKCGFPVRSKKAIEARITRLGLSRKLVIDNLPSTVLATELGVPCETFRGWIVGHGLPYYKFADRLGYVPLKEFRRWAVKNAKLLSHLDRDRLLWAIESEELVDRILATPPTHGKPKKIRHVATGQEFKSMRQAAKAFHYANHSVIRYAIKRGEFVEVG